MTRQDYPTREDLALNEGVAVEYRVIEMNGHPKTSSVYSSTSLGADARDMAYHIQRTRGGKVRSRVIQYGEWVDDVG